MPDSWSTIASKVGTSSWSGLATVTVMSISVDWVHLEVQSLQNLRVDTTFLRLKVEHSSELAVGGQRDDCRF
jgi:hypothetical protein